jgi:hypothetical protein
MDDFWGDDESLEKCDASEILKSNENSDASEIFESKVQLPLFPGVRKLFGFIQDDMLEHVDVENVLFALEYSGQAFERKKEWANSLSFVFTSSCHHVWDGEQWRELKLSELVPVIPTVHLGEFVTKAIARKRKASDKMRLLKKFHLAPDHVKDIPTNIQDEVIKRVQSMTGWHLEEEVQHKTDTGKRYRLDAVFEGIMAVAIDENGHKGYDKKDEVAWTRFMESKYAIFVRFNPHQPLPPDVFHVSHLLLRELLKFRVSMASHAFDRLLAEKKP